MSEVGSGQVAIFPTFRGFRSSVNSEVAGAGREGGKTFSSAFSAGAGDPGAALVKKLNAQIASGAKALSAARLSEQDATGKVRIAEAALNEARSKGEAGSARVIAAEERLATAKRKLAEASGRTITATDQLRQSQARLAEATAAAGSAGEQSAGRFARGWQSLKQRVTGSAKSAVDAEGTAARGSADRAGREAGNSFASSFKAGIGVLAGALGAGVFGSFIAEAGRASDATDKFKATMDFAGLDNTAIADATAAAKEYADQTVFDLPTIQNTIAQLASNGVKDYTGLTKAAGNLNAVAGGNADTFKSVAMVMTQTAGAGKLTTENWNQMADAIPGAAGPLMKSLEEAGAYTGNFRDAMADGQITADEFNAALMKLGNDPVAVEAAKSTKTFEGAIGNLQATINSGLMGALDKMKPGITGAINLLSGGLGKAFEWTGKAASGLFDLFGNGDFTGNLREAFNVEEDSGFVGFLFNARDAAIQLWSGLTMGRDVRDQFHGQLTGIVAFGAGARAVFDEVVGGFRAFKSAFIANDGDITSSGFAGFLEQLGSNARTMFDAVGPLFQQLGSIFMDLLPTVVQLWSSFSPITLIFAALQPVLPTIVAMLSSLAGVLSLVLTQALTQLTPLIQTLVTTLSGALVQAMPIINDLMIIFMNALTQIVPVVLSLMGAIIPLAASLISQLAPIFMQLVTAILPPLASIFGDIVAAIAPLIQQIAGLLIPIIQALMPVVVTVFGVIVNVITSVMQIIQGIIQVVTGIISGNWSQVWAGIGNIFGGIWNTIVALVSGAVQIVWSVISNGLNLVFGFIGTILGGIGSFFADTWANITNGVSGFISGFLGFFNDLPGNIMNALAGAGTWLLDVGKNIVQGLIDGAKGMIDTAVNAIKDVGGAMLDGVKGFLGIKSPSRRFRYEVGQQVGEGARLGILDKVKETEAAAKKLVTVPDVNAGAGAGAQRATAQGARSALAGAQVTVNMPIRDQMSPEGVARAFDNRLNYKLRRERV